MRNTNKVIPQLKNRADKLSTIREATSVREIDLATLETVTGGWEVSITITFKSK
jgi:hypothetical protein